MADVQRTCLVSGTTGYLGRRVKAALERRGWRVLELTRRPAGGAAVQFRLGADVSAAALAGARALVHCAYDFEPRSWPDIQRVNVAGSKALFRAAHEANIETVIHISSISAFEGCRSLYGRAKLETEQAARAVGATVIRPGLIWGDPPGGMFGRLVDQVRSARVLPLVGGGSQVQYLAHDEDLTELLCNRVEGTLPSHAAPITVAHPQPWTFRQILDAIARREGKNVHYVPVPWRTVWLALKAAELVGAKPTFRSDSLLSLAHQNPSPGFGALQELNVRCRPFAYGAPTGSEI